MIDKATNIEIKKINRNSIYRLVLAKENTSKQEIAYQLKLSIPTVAQNLGELIECGLVKENGTFRSTGGRKAKIISSNPTARVALGLDITRNHVNFIMVDLGCHVLKYCRYRIPFRADKEYYLTLKSIIEDMVSDVEVEQEQILGVGISLPTIVGADRKSILYSWILDDAINLYEELAPYIQYPYYFFNDANAGGFAELYCNQYSQNMLYLSLSNSVGGAVLIDGKLYNGENWRSGEFGHMTLVPDGRLCYCGKKGHVDAYCSALLLSNVTDGNLGVFFERLAAGDKECKKVWEEYVYYLALLINNIQVGFDCEIILGGYVGSHIKPYLEQIREKVIEQCNFHLDKTMIRVSQFNEEASVLGAALYYVDEFIGQI